MKSEPLPRNICRSFSVLFRVNVSPHHISLEYLIYHLSLGMSSHSEGRTKLHEIKVSEKLEKGKRHERAENFPKKQKANNISLLALLPSHSFYKHLLLIPLIHTFISCLAFSYLWRSFVFKLSFY
jgi:hypothetical protein